MKKTLTVLAITALMGACTKESGNSGMIKKENEQTILPVDRGDSASAVVNSEASSDAEPGKKTYRYVAEDGSSAHVTFGSSDQGKFISIRSHNKTINVKHKERTGAGDIYQEYDITVTAAGEQVTIDQSGTVIELRKARGQ